jgi:membrane protein
MLSDFPVKCYTLVRMHQVRTFIFDLYRSSREDSLLRHSAAVAYYAVFSLPALMLVIFSIVRTVLQRTSVEADILQPVRIYMGDGTAQLLQQAAEALERHNLHGGWPAAVGGVLLLVSAIGLVRELQASLNEILGLNSSRESVREAVVRYLSAIVPLMLIGGILALSLGVSTVLAIIEEHFAEAVDLQIDTLQLSSYVVIVGALTAIFTVLYAVLPAKRYPFGRILLCAAGAAVILLIGSIIVSAMAVFTSIGSMYGVAAGLLVLLFWMFFCSNVFFVGAECIDLLSRPTRKR